MNSINMAAFHVHEKRKHKRIKCNEPILIKFKDMEYLGIIKDKSEKGFSNSNNLFFRFQK